MTKLVLACATLFLAGGLVLATGACGGGDDSSTPGATPPVPPLAFDDFQTADVVIGQANFTNGMANGGGTTDADVLGAPFGSPAQGSLYLADQFNNRIIVFNVIPNVNGGAATFAVGQNDLVSSAGGTTANSFQSPSDVFIAGNRLLLADFTNSRVLIWNALPLGNTNADVAVGQPNLTSSASALTAGGMDHPASVYVDGSRLFVADTNNQRILIWNSIPGAHGTPADVVVGQPDFTTNSPGVTQAKIGSPFGVWAGNGRLIVADSSNHRVLIWNPIPTSDGTPANVVIGQPNFTTKTPGSGAMALRSPLGVTVRANQLFVADSGNHRVLVYDQIPTTNQPAASRVIGQSNFNMTAANDDNQDGADDGNPSDRTLNLPTALRVFGTQLLITDSMNNRILILNAP